MHTVVVSMLYAYSRKILLLSTLASMPYMDNFIYAY